MELRDKILLFKGALQMVGILCLIWALIWMVKHSTKLEECYYSYLNGSVEATGLYGNCQWIDDYTTKVVYTQLGRDIDESIWFKEGNFTWNWSGG